MTDYFAGDPRSMRERMLAGDLYLADDPELARDSIRAAGLADRYNRTWPQNRGAAVGILRELLGGLGAETEIRPPLYVDYGRYLTVGARTFINYSLTALDVAPITIGDDVQIGPNVQLLGDRCRRRGDPGCAGQRGGGGESGARGEEPLNCRPGTGSFAVDDAWDSSTAGV